MTEEELKIIAEALEKRYLLVPKTKVFHFLGGAFAFAIIAFGLSYAGVLAGMKSSAAQEALSKINEGARSVKIAVGEANMAVANTSRSYRNK